MSQRYTAVFEWDGEAPAISALDGWRGGRLVRLTLEDERTEESGGSREFHEVVIDGRTYRTTSQKLVEEIQRQTMEIREMNGRLIAANRTLQNVQAQLATARRNETVGHMERAGLTDEEAEEVVKRTTPWSGPDPCSIVQRVVEFADSVRIERVQKLLASSDTEAPAESGHMPLCPISSPLGAPKGPGRSYNETIEHLRVIEEEHRYLSSALLSRCGPRAIGETWVDYARRCMGQS